MREHSQTLSVHCSIDHGKFNFRRWFIQHIYDCTCIQKRVLGYLLPGSICIGQQARAVAHVCTLMWQLRFYLLGTYTYILSRQYEHSVVQENSISYVIRTLISKIIEFPINYDCFTKLRNLSDQQTRRSQWRSENNKGTLQRCNVAIATIKIEIQIIQLSRLLCTLHLTLQHYSYKGFDRSYSLVTALRILQLQQVDQSFSGFPSEKLATPTSWEDRLVQE